MAISKSKAKELADLLPDGRHCNNARERLLCVLELLLTLTDENHPLSNAEIRAVLRAKHGAQCAPSENTIAADLRAICTSEVFGLGVHTTPSGTWIERTDLTPTKVRLLLNAVQASRFLTVAQSNDLQEGLGNLVSRHQEDELASEVFVDRRVRQSGMRVFAFLDTIAAAMRTDRKIEFTYTYSGFDSKPHALPGDDGAITRVETPIAICYADGIYYAETYTSHPWRHGITLTRCRVDRMMDLRVSQERADHDRASYQARRSARRRLEQSFEMVDGTERHIFLRVKGWATNILFDRFGFGLHFDLAEGIANDPAASRITMVVAPESFTFFRWLSAAGDGIVMVEPPSDALLLMGPWRKQLKGIEHEELVDDYRTMVEGFLAYLERARAPYA